MSERSARALAEDLAEEFDSLPYVVVDRLVLVGPDLRRAPGTERTPSRRIAGTRQRPPEGDALALGLGVRVGDRREQGVGVRVRRFVEQLLGPAEFHDVAEVHHGHAIADVANDREIVGDEQITQAELLLKVLQEIQNLRLHRDVERRDRSVEDDELGRERERPSDADALVLAPENWCRYL